MEPSKFGEGKKEQRTKVPANSLQVRIVAACSQREVTPREIAEQEGLPRDTVGYHFNALKNAGYIKVSRKETVRGVQRHYYVATRQRVTTTGEFEQMSIEERREVSHAFLLDLLTVCREAYEAETLDARSDSHLSWCPFELDEQGWEELMSEEARMLERSFEIQAGALARLRESGEDPIHTIFGLIGFEGAEPASTKTAFTVRTDPR